MKISIIIPVYNEADRLAVCLEAIGKQIERPLEVLVIDNNSTDSTVEVAEGFPFVTLLHEKRQGVVHARNRGFNAAQGDIIGRIDADTIIPADWTQQLAVIFANSEVDAVSGAVSYYDLPYQALAAKIDLFFRQHIADNMGNEVFLYGANMAIRRSSWQQVRASTCRDAGLHEDFDLAIHSHALGAAVRFDKRLMASVSLRRADVSAKSFRKYALISPQTYALHGRTSQRYMYPAVGLAISFYWFIKIWHRGYDPNKAGFSFQRFRAHQALARVNPATYVD